MNENLYLTPGSNASPEVCLRVWLRDAWEDWPKVYPWPPAHRAAQAPEAASQTEGTKDRRACSRTMAQASLPEVLAEGGGENGGEQSWEQLRKSLI